MNNPSDRIVTYFESLAPAHLARIGDIYAPNARFVDPFNDVVGEERIRAIFAHMFETLEKPSFVIIDRIENPPQCFLTWDFHFRFRRFRQEVTHRIHGGSHLILGPDGRISLHRDYWDAASLYEKLPLLGAPMRWLRSKAGS